MDFQILWKKLSSTCVSLYQDYLHPALADLMPNTFWEPCKILKGRNFYKPFDYPQFYEAWNTHERMRWIPREVPMADDIRDWNERLDDSQRNLLSSILRFFTQGDVEVAGGYCSNAIPLFWRTPELAMLLLSIANRESTHIDAYSYLIESLPMPDTIYSDFLKYNEMKDKQSYLNKYQNTCGPRFDVVCAWFLWTLITCSLLSILNVGSGLILSLYVAIVLTNYISTRRLEHIAASIALFSGFTEGMQLFSTFMILLEFSHHGVMNGVGTIVLWSVNDESLHCDKMMEVMRIFVDENLERKNDWITLTFGRKWGNLLFGPRGIRTDVLSTKVKKIAKEMVFLEDNFIDLIFNMYGKEDFYTLNRNTMKQFIRYITDYRLRTMRFDSIYNIKVNPVPDFGKKLKIPNLASFFEVRNTDYSVPLNFDWDKLAWGNRQLIDNLIDSPNTNNNLKNEFRELKDSLVSDNKKRERRSCSKCNSSDGTLSIRTKNDVDEYIYFHSECYERH